jgi:hypothetical protein
MTVSNCRDWREVSCIAEESDGLRRPAPRGVVGKWQVISCLLYKRLCRFSNYANQLA